MGSLPQAVRSRGRTKTSGPWTGVVGPARWRPRDLPATRSCLCAGLLPPDLAQERFSRLLPAKTLRNACCIFSKLHFITPDGQALCHPRGQTPFAGGGQQTHLARNRAHNPHPTASPRRLLQDSCPAARWTAASRSFEKLNRTRKLCSHQTAATQTARKPQSRRACLVNAGVTFSAHFMTEVSFFTREVISMATHREATRRGNGRVWSPRPRLPPQAHPEVLSPPSGCSATTGGGLALTLETNDGPPLPLHRFFVPKSSRALRQAGAPQHRFHTAGFETDTQQEPHVTGPLSFPGGHRASGRWSLSST